MKQNTERLLAAAAALTAWFGTGVLLFNAIFNHPDTGLLPSLLSHIHYFTILSNYLAALCLSAMAFPSLRALNFFRKPVVQGSAATAIIITGIVYHLLLAGSWHPVGLMAVSNLIVHSIMPVIYPLIWFRFQDHQIHSFAVPATWLLYPLGYFVYALLLGIIRHHYPYFFIDPTVLSFPWYMLSIALLGSSFYLVSLGLHSIAVAVNRTAKRK